MSLFKKIQSSFTGGEISPRLLARTDLKVYDQSVKEMTNFYPLTHGGATRRRGTEFIGEVDDSSKPARLMRFVYSRTQSYLLIMNNSKIQFVRNKEFVTIASPAGRYEIAIPYTDDELSEITYAQSGNVMIICHPNHHPKLLERNDDDDWTLTDIDFVYNAISDYPFENHYIRFQIITAGDGHSVGNVYTITVNGDGTYSFTTPGGSPAPVGDIVSIEVNQLSIVEQVWTITCVYKNEDREEWTVTGAGTGSPVTASLGDPTVQWSPGNYPKAVSFYEQRLFFGGSSLWPQRVWGSALADYFNMTPGPADNDAVDFQIASNNYDQIIHLETTRQLLPLSYGAEFSMSGPTGSTITPGAVSVRSHTFHGTTDVRPIRIGQEVLFVQRDGKKIRALSYDLALDSNVAPDLTIMAEHITGDGIVDMSYAQDPDAIMWLIREDGVLLSLTHVRDQEVTGWAKHTTEGNFKNVCTLPESVADTVYLCVERTIDSNTVKYIEFFTSDIYLDCSLTLSVGSPALATDTWTGLDHLEGQTVSIVADGSVHAARTVTGGSITLQRDAEEVVVGLNYDSTLVLLHPEIPTNDGTSQGRQTRIAELVIRLQDTIGAKVNDIQQPVIELPLMLDTPPVPFTGDKSIYLSGWGYPNNITILQDIPMPITVLGVILKLEVND